MPSETIDKSIKNPLTKTIGDLNKCLVKLQDIYEGLEPGQIKTNGEVDPFEYYDPDVDTTGVRSLSKEIVSKVNFLEQRLNS